MQSQLWKNNVEEFDNLAELKTLLRDLSVEEKRGEVEVKKVFRAADKVYFVWWKSST